MLWQDFLPLLTMLPCAKTLAIHWRCQRYSDVVVFAVGTLLAVIYHWLHMHPEVRAASGACYRCRCRCCHRRRATAAAVAAAERLLLSRCCRTHRGPTLLHAPPVAAQGIANTELLGLPGSAWRGLDILMAQGLLARTLGHAVGARTGLVLFLANLAFPATLLSYAHLLAGGVLTLGFASKVGGRPPRVGLGGGRRRWGFAVPTAGSRPAVWPARVIKLPARA